MLHFPLPVSTLLPSRHSTTVPVLTPPSLRDRSPQSKGFSFPNFPSFVLSFLPPLHPATVPGASTIISPGREATALSIWSSMLAMVLSGKLAGSWKLSSAALRSPPRLPQRSRSPKIAPPTGLSFGNAWPPIVASRPGCCKVVGSAA